MYKNIKAILFNENERDNRIVDKFLRINGPEFFTFKNED